MDDLLDFVAAHRTTHIATTAGERLRHSGPLPDDLDALLVAGTARPGGFRPRFELPAGEVLLSPDHSRLAVQQGDLWRTFDLATGGEGYRFEQEGPACLCALHPSGEMMARRTNEALELWLPDGNLFRSLPVSRREYAYGMIGIGLEEMLTFSVCGKYLWFAACPADAPDGLWLVGVPGWTVLERAPVPRGPDRLEGGEEAEVWSENEMVVHPETGWLGISRWGGESFLSITFHRAKGRKIITHEHQVRSGDGFHGGNGVGYLTPGRGGWWYGFEQLGCVLGWDWPGVAAQAAGSSGSSETICWDGFAAVGAVLLAHAEDGEIHLLRPDTLEAIQTVRPYASGQLLPNGALLQPEGDAMRLLAFEAGKKDVDVVLEMDGEDRCCRKVWRQVRRRWRDVTAEVAWVVPGFDFERE